VSSQKRVRVPDCLLLGGALASGLVKFDSDKTGPVQVVQVAGLLARLSAGAWGLGS
jgi:hypothetical protein